MNFRIRILSALLLAGLASAAIIGCGDDDSSPTNPGNGNNENMPLAIGNYWVMNNRAYTSNVLDSTYVDTFKIDTSYTANGKTWFGNKADSSFIRTGADGVYELVDFGEGSMTEVLIYKPTAHVGDKWYYPIGSDSMEIECRSISETAVTPAGTFTGCHRYLWTAMEGAFTTDMTIKAGVGPVKLIATSSFFGIAGRSESDLKSYHIQ